MLPSILVVEDDPHMLHGICETLALAGYQAQPASNGAEALALLEQGPFDLILSDIMMPNLDGYQLFERVRSNPAWTAVPFIFLTAKGQKTDIRLGKQLGADDYLIKPFEVEDLLVAVQSKLERSRALRQAVNVEFTQLKQTILNTLSHEFRTPLTYITGYTELLEEGDFEIEEFKQLLGYIRKGSDRLKRLVEDFLFIVMLETGETRSAYLLERAVCRDLAAQLSALLNALESQAAARQVSLKRQVPDKLPTLVCHTKYVLDAVSRLVDNGIKFSKREGGVVTVRAWADSRAVCISVSDAGVGIGSDQQDKLFERFSQINREQQEQQGTGLGLYIVKGIVTLHGGQVDVQSAPGVGSTFTISLPLQPDAA
jgi:two-component system sensor histidine kinase/response regulator